MGDVEKCVRQIVATSDVHVITKRMVLKQYKQLKGVDRLLRDEKNKVKSILDLIVLELAQNPELLRSPGKKDKERKHINEEERKPFSGAKNECHTTNSTELQNSSPTAKTRRDQEKFAISGIPCETEEPSHSTERSSVLTSSKERADTQNPVDHSLKYETEISLNQQKLKTLSESGPGHSCEQDRIALPDLLNAEDNVIDKWPPNNKENILNLNCRPSKSSSFDRELKSSIEHSFILNHSLIQKKKDSWKWTSKQKNHKFLSVASVREAILDSDYSVDSVDTSESECAITPQKKGFQRKDDGTHVSAVHNDSKQMDKRVKSYDVYDIGSSSNSDLSPIKTVRKSKSNTARIGRHFLEDTESDCASPLSRRNGNFDGCKDRGGTKCLKTSEKTGLKEKDYKKLNRVTTTTICDKQTDKKVNSVKKNIDVYDIGSSSNSELTPIKPIKKSRAKKNLKNSSHLLDDSESDCETPVPHRINNSINASDSSRLNALKRNRLEVEETDCSIDLNEISSSNDSKQAGKGSERLTACKNNDACEIESSSNSEISVTPVNKPKTNARICDQSNFLEDSESDCESPIGHRNSSSKRRRSKKLIIDTSESEFAETPMKITLESNYCERPLENLCSTDEDKISESDHEVTVCEKTETDKCKHKLHGAGRCHRKILFSLDSEDSDIHTIKADNSHDDTVKELKVTSCDRDSVVDTKCLNAYVAITPLKKISKCKLSKEMTMESDDVFHLSYDASEDEESRDENHLNRCNISKGKLNGTNLKGTHAEKTDVFCLSDDTDDSWNVCEPNSNLKSYSSDRYGSDVKIQIIYISPDDSDIEDIKQGNQDGLDVLEDLDRMAFEKMKRSRKVTSSKKNTGRKGRKANPSSEVVAENSAKRRKITKSTIFAGSSSSSSDSEDDKNTENTLNRSLRDVKRPISVNSSKDHLTNDSSSDDEKPLVILVNSDELSDSTSLETIEGHQSPREEAKTSTKLAMIKGKESKAISEKPGVVLNPLKKKGRQPPWKNSTSRRRVSKGKRMTKAEERLKLEEELRQLEGSEGFRKAHASDSVCKGRTRRKSGGKDDVIPRKQISPWKQVNVSSGNIFENLRDIISDEES